MERWLPAPDFIEADVVRWTQGVFDRRGGAKKSLLIGELRVVAEVLQCSDDGWLRLLVRASEITRETYAGKPVPALTVGSTIKRARKTILRGKPERLPWSDESARQAILSRSRFVVWTGD